MNNNQQRPQASKTDQQQVQRQNAAAEQGAGYNTEFASETNAQEVREQNRQSESNKQQSSNQQKNR